MDRRLKNEYKNDDISVVWQPHLCIHSKSCWKGMKSVFNPLKRPWVTMEGGTTEGIIAQIGKCPSGALSYYKLKEETMEKQESNDENIKVKVIPGGPLMVTGTCEITHADGTIQVKENKTTYCRCGLSANKPFCDGGHKGTGWDK